MHAAFVDVIPRRECLREKIDQHTLEAVIGNNPLMKSVRRSNNIF